MASEEYFFFLSIEVLYELIGLMKSIKNVLFNVKNSDKYLMTKCASVNRYKNIDNEIFIVIND